REISRHYALDGNNLVLLDESEAEVQSTPAERYVDLPVRLDVPAGSSRSVDGSLAPGHIASFVTDGRAGQGLDLTVRSAFVNRAVGQASELAAAFARSRAPIFGVAIVVPSRGVVFAENADTQVPTASIVKALVLLVVLEQARQVHRPVAEEDLALLWPMITE